MAKFKLNNRALTAGGMAGGVQGLATSFSPDFGGPAADIAIGAYTGNETLQTLGARELGRRLVGATAIPGADGGGFLD